ncbi:MAG: stage V sporulation T C-terminal domain-containing protein [Oscillospiraceae bacterium]
MVKIPDEKLREEISVYARISVDTERESDSNTSIENQLRIINTFINQHFPNCTVREYIDRDRSGYTFEERENYMTMRENLLSGKSKILIVKDFSRFSRRTSLGLNELEKMRDKDIRIISVMDGIDYPTNDEWTNIAIRFLFNEMPVTETSKKVRGVIDMKQKAGEWLCAVPYGYIIKNQKKNNIEVVPDEAEVIREIFRLYSEEGWGYKKIANYLTEKNIPTPRMKEKERAEEEDKEYGRKVKNEWSIISVQTILHNDYYIGTFRGHKYTRKTIKGKDKKLDESEHIVIQKHHEPIIDDRTFLYTQELLQNRTTLNYRGVKKYETPYTGYLFCGDCKEPMFSRSRPDLAPSYICGTYHKRGLKACSAHHIRLDFLDGVLKDYIKLVKLNCKEMIEELEKVIVSEEQTVIDSENIIKNLEKQLYDAKEELKALKLQKIKDISRKPQDEDIITEAYAELEDEIMRRIYGCQERLKDNAEKRSSVIEIARISRTVFDVFDDILNKEKLSKADISLIVDRIDVYADGKVDIKLKGDIDELLKTGKLPKEEYAVNFQFDSIGNSFETRYICRPKNRSAKAYTVNVISGGDPLEIYTSADGEVIFKKYSAIGEMSGNAAAVADVITKLANCPVIIFDRDHVIAVAGVQKREFNERRVSAGLEELLEKRKTYIYKNGEQKIFPVEGIDRPAIACAPILTSGDVTGAVAFLSPSAEATATDVHFNLVQAAAQFLGKQIED